MMSVVTSLLWAKDQNSFSTYGGQGAGSMGQGAGSREHSRVQETEGAGSRRSLEEYLLCHVAVLIVLGQSPDQLQQLLPLLGRSAPPARLQGELSLVPV